MKGGVKEVGSKKKIDRDTDTVKFVTAGKNYKSKVVYLS